MEATRFRVRIDCVQFGLQSASLKDFGANSPTKFGQILGQGTDSPREHLVDHIEMLYPRDVATPRSARSAGRVRVAGGHAA
jgi:hypothetical protein